MGALLGLTEALFYLMTQGAADHLAPLYGVVLYGLIGAAVGAGGGLVGAFAPKKWRSDGLAFALGWSAAFVLIGGFAIRHFEGADDRAFWIDGLGLDSRYDYDPLWQRLVDLKVVASVHSGAMGWNGRRSISNFSYNHMGHFAGANEVTAKSLFFGGVFHRFPQLRIGFLEGGAGWALQMLISLVEHFEKRGPHGLTFRDPAGIDGPLFDRLVEEHAGPMPVVDGFGSHFKQMLATPEVVNDFELAGIEEAGDIVRQITSQCFIGCEADDALAGVAFDTSRWPGDAPLRPMFSSDMGHWDVAHMHEVLPEAVEHVERGWMNPGQLRAFLCDNVVQMCMDVDPGFFDGTAVESYVAQGSR